MCGIIGIVNNTNIVPTVLSSLSKLEYRGYDSSGIATLNKNNIHYRKTKGKLSNLKTAIRNKALLGFLTTTLIL